MIEKGKFGDQKYPAGATLVSPTYVASAIVAAIA
jgi:hypothetical protein